MSMKSVINFVKPKQILKAVNVVFEVCNKITNIR